MPIVNGEMVVGAPETPFGTNAGEIASEDMTVTGGRGWWDALVDPKDTSEGTKYASDYEGVVPGPRASFTYEAQEGIPVDGSSAMARKLSPFTLRLLPPNMEDLPLSFVGLAGEPTLNVDVYSQAGTSMNANNEAASAMLQAYGISGPAYTQAQVADTLNQQIAAGQFLNTASGNQIRTTLTDAMTAMDIAAQVSAILNTPPLTLLINPSSMNISYNGIQSYQDRGREGFIFQRWGEDQPSIKFQGQTGAFIAGESTGGIRNASIQAFREEGTTETATGVQFASKRNSAAFQNFQALYQIYRNNGYIYDRIGKSEANLAIGAVSIAYDQWVYIGHIESFDYAYDTSQIHAIEWSMDFRVDVMYDVSQTPSAVLPLDAPTPNPSAPGRSTLGSAKRSSTGLMFSGDPSSISEEFTDAVDFGQPPVLEGGNAPPPMGGSGGSSGSLVATNPDGTPILTNPNVGG